MMSLCASLTKPFNQTMQANRITVSRRAPRRIPLDALRCAWTSAAHARADSTGQGAGQHTRRAARALASQPPRQDHLGLDAALSAVNFLAQLDNALRFTSVSDASIAFIGYHRDYLSMLTLHDLVPSEEADELNALIARARISDKLESATLNVVKSLTYPICVELRHCASCRRPRTGNRASRSPRSMYHIGASARNRCSTRSITTPSPASKTPTMSGSMRACPLVQGHARQCAGVRAAADQTVALIYGD